MRFVGADLVVSNRWALKVNPLMELAEEKGDFCFRPLRFL